MLLISIDLNIFLVFLCPGVTSFTTKGINYTALQTHTTMAYLTYFILVELFVIAAFL